MRARIAMLLAAAALSGVAAQGARAQNPTVVDSRWLAYVGCWRSIEVGRESTLCVVPGPETAAIDLVTIDSGGVVAAEQIVATGQRMATARGDCTGWERAQWSEVSDRVYLRSEETCPGWGTRTGTGLLALTHEGQLLYLQGNTVAAKTGVRVQRFREAGAGVELPSEVRDALNAVDASLTATARARAAASAPLAIEDLAEASRALDVEVVEAWLIARGGAFNLDADRLVALAQAGIPPRVTDLMIALANPGVFVVDARARRGARRAGATTSPDSSYIGTTGAFPQFYGRSCAALDYWFFAGYGIVPFSSSYCDGSAYLYPYAYGWYPVTIIYTGSGTSGSGSSRTSHGRVVNGRGYQEGVVTNPDVGRTGIERPRSTGGVAGGTPSASASAGEQRTAKPRP
jgi:hypothetical protein